MNIVTYNEFVFLFILFIFACLQWMLIFIYFIKNHHQIKKLDQSLFESFKNYTVSKKVPFYKDYYFFYWNLFPIIYFIYFSMLVYSWDDKFATINMITKGNISDIFSLFFDKVNIFNTLIEYRKIDILIIIMTLIYIYFISMGTQFKKQQQFIKETKQIYWWDIRISKYLFIVRLIFLISNVILVSFITYIITKVTLFTIFILYSKYIKFIANPFYPDNYGGLKILMEVSSIIISMYFFRAMMGIVGFLDHKGVKTFKQYVGDIYNMLYVIIGFVYFILITYGIYKILSKVDTSIYMTQNIYNKFLIQDSNFSTTIVNKISTVSDYYTPLINFNKYPFDLSLLSNSILTIVLPLSLWFLLNFISNRRQNINGTLSKNNKLTKDDNIALYYLRKIEMFSKILIISIMFICICIIYHY